jgi:predicted dehydrogenase
MRKLKAGLVGLGFGRQIIERQILEGPAEPYIDLRAVCDLNREKCDAAAGKYGVKATYAIDELTEDADLDVIIDIAGPNGRAGRIRQMIQAGKDVMTTKPFEMKAAEAASILAEAREMGRIVYLNSPAAVRNKDFETIREWENRYSLGRLVAGHHECWYKSVEAADGSWYDDPKQCPAAPILRLGIYGINDLLQFFGEPEEVQLMETRIFTGRPTPDLARLSIKFKSGAIVDTMNGWVPQPARNGLAMTLYYENGTIFRNPAIYPNDFELEKGVYLCLLTKDDTNGLPRETLRLKNEETSVFYAWEAFHQAVTTRKRPENETPDNVIVNSIRVLEAVARAAAGNGIAKVEPLGEG